MPRWDWRCLECGYRFEAWARNAESVVSCPVCLEPGARQFSPSSNIVIKKHFCDFVRSDLEPAKEDTESWDAMTNGNQYHKPKHLSYKEWLQTPEGRRG